MSKNNDEQSNGNDREEEFEIFNAADLANVVAYSTMAIGIFWDREENSRILTMHSITQNLHYLQGTKIIFAHTPFVKRLGHN